MVMAVLSSRMHLAWARAVSGRLENRISYGSTQVYNPYPLPRVVGNENEVLDGLGLRLIDVRQPYIDDGRNLAWLYDPKTMPEDLRAVHDELDEEFESMYVGRRFKDDAERLEHMFRLYAKMKG